jgi:hypothetical protein
LAHKDTLGLTLNRISLLSAGEPEGIKFLCDQVCDIEVSPKIFVCSFGKQLKVLARLKIACQEIFAKKNQSAKIFLEMAETFRL